MNAKTWDLGRDTWQDHALFENVWDRYSHRGKHFPHNNINLDEDEFDELFSAVTKSTVMSPGRKAAYARLEFLERKYAARNAEIIQARNARHACKKAKQAESDSQVGIGAQLFCPLHASKRL